MCVDTARGHVAAQHAQIIPWYTTVPLLLMLHQYMYQYWHMYHGRVLPYGYETVHMHSESSIESTRESLSAVFGA